MRRKLIRKFKKAKSSRAAFTLTEVIVASSILALAMVPVLKGLTNAHLTSIFIEQKTKSLSYAQLKFEEVKARSIYDYASSLAENNTPLSDGYLCSVTDSATGTDLRNISISAGFDENTDSVLDTDEIKVTLQTSLARRW